MKACDNEARKVCYKCMGSTFTACVLTQRGRSAPDFLISEVNLRPGQELFPTSGENVLLASGFATLTPDTAFPLSPTLQLNKDLAGVSPEHLRRLALAELARIQATTFHSYAVEPDPRLCVLGGDAERLKGFVDTYGGLFEIEPLLVQGCDAAIPTAVNLELSRDGHGLLLEYALRLPVDRERCRYCGSCSVACPEGCLDEHLFLDYSVCTFCGACEQACPRQAIDIHGGEERSLRVPALLLLDGTRLDLPADRQGIYWEQDLPAYFSSQCALQVDEVVTCEMSLCQYNSRRGTGCRLCIAGCPHGAVAAGSAGIEIDSQRCRECGGCVAVCPTGAMQYQRYRDRVFINYLEALQLEAGTTVVLGSARELHALWWQNRGTSFGRTLFLEYPEIGTLSLFHLLCLHLLGAGRIVLLGDEGRYQPNTPLGRNATLAGALLESCSGQKEAILLTTVARFPLLPREAALSLLPIFTGRLSGSRRQNLADLLAHLCATSGGQGQIAGAESLPFATIFCDPDRCSHCYACLNVCRIGALRVSEDLLQLRWLGALCTGCGGCVEVCPEKALQVERDVTLDADFVTSRLLAAAEPMHCSSCGQVFGNQKSYERVMEKLAGRAGVDPHHFSQCGTCRVIALSARDL